MSLPRGKRPDSWVKVREERRGEGAAARAPPGRGHLSRAPLPARISLESQTERGPGAGRGERALGRSQALRFRHPGSTPRVGEARRTTTRLFPPPSRRPRLGVLRLQGGGEKTVLG